MEDIYNELIKKIDENRVLKNEPMSKHTTFRIGGPADLFLKVETLDELKYAIEICNSKEIPVTVIGNGSNVLVKDSGIRGVTIKLNFNELELKENNIIKAGSGVMLPKISNLAYENELTGFEFACGIPGSIGGAIRMNAGAHGKPISKVIYSTTYLDKSDLSIHTIDNKGNEFGYRESLFSKNSNYIIISAEIKLEHGIKEDIKSVINENIKYRKETQPINFPSAGSAFKRGKEYISAKLIDEAGLKGLTVGGAQVSEKHAGFIINKGNATAKDVLELMEIIKQKVKEKYNVELEREIEILGE